MERRIPAIVDCDAEDCAYNRDRACLHGKIIIGADGLPQCRAYVRRQEAASGGEGAGAVHECRDELCAFNRAFECVSPAVYIRMRNKRPNCAVFSSRMVHNRAA